MFDVFAAYATDEKKENEGVEVVLGPEASITVARMNNPKFNQMITAEFEKHQAALEALPEDQRAKLDAEIMNKVLAETILLGFKGLGWQGKPLKYSKESALKLLSLKDFKVRVLAEANKLDNFRAVWEEAGAKN
jgi:hypothetical protein